MRVRVSIGLDIDSEAWTMNYGVKGDRAIREDIQRYVTNLVTEQLGEVDVLERRPEVGDLAYNTRRDTAFSTWVGEVSDVRAVASGVQVRFGSPGWFYARHYRFTPAS